MCFRTYESNLATLTTSWFPRYFARDAYDASTRIQAALEKWYEARRDEADDVSAIVKTRAGIYRNYGFTNTEIAEMELGLLHVSTSNTIPAAFWFLSNVVSRNELLEEIREQLEDIVQKNEEGTILRLERLEESCPLLVSCWNEALRISIHAGHFRRVLNDTTISDGQGTSFLLKKGTDVLMSSDCSHSVESVWGLKPSSFDPEHFSASTHGTKTRKSAFHPFGGGKHLCPGRNYAYTEILGFVAGLILTYNVEPATGAGVWKLPEMENAMFFEAAAKPVDHGNEFSVVFTKRQPWEKAKLVLKDKYH